MRGVIQNPARERRTYSNSSKREKELLKVQQEREKELFKNQQEREGGKRRVCEPLKEQYEQRNARERERERERYGGDDEGRKRSA